MIGKLKGVVDSTGEDSLLIDVGGVCYEVFCSGRTVQACAPGEAATLIIETHVREDHIHLYGFPSAEERQWFRLLTSVQRVGAKMGLNILHAHTPDALAHAISSKDTTAFSRISGIGPKLAERIVAELKDKVVDVGYRISDVSKKTTSDIRHPTSTLQDAISALTHLGYARAQATEAATRVAREAGEDAGMDVLIRKSLKELA